MKNLELLELIYKPTNALFTNVQYFAQTSKHVYFINAKTLNKFTFSNNCSEVVCPVEFDDIVCLKVLHIEHKVCVAAKTKLFIVDPDGSKEVQNLDFEVVIAAISWNPTEEVVVVVCENGDVKAFRVDYENAEVFAQGESNVGAKIPDTVYVGWGSKETQFRGSEGKFKPQHSPEEIVPVADQKPAISWRGNGEMFAVNYWADNRRKFAVFESPCNAIYRSEDCPGLQPPISWRPTGNMIATLTQTPQNQNVVIFEKNGQKRFAFNLNFEAQVTEFKWSPCSQILTMASYDQATQTHNIHLFISSNYKWYEKQRLTFNLDNPLLAFAWLEAPQFMYKLRVITASYVIDYTFRNVITKQKAMCGVIDGETLKITNFEEAIIPPIMSGSDIINDKAINFAALSPHSTVMVDSGNNLKVYDVTNRCTNTLNLGNLLDNLPKFPLAAHHFVIADTFLYFAAATELMETTFYRLNLQNNELNFINANSDPFRNLTFVPNNGAQIAGLKSVDDGLYISVFSPHLVYQEVKILDQEAYNCQLLSNCQFYVNDDKLSESVNSFVIFDNYLLYTTKLNELYCVRFTKGFMENKTVNYHRNMEQGASIVAAIPNSSQIVLQLPRDRLLNAENWVEALRFIRLEKLNANLLFDLAPNRFLGQIDKFIVGAKTLNELNSLVLEFEEGNVLATVYKNWGKSADFSEKIGAIFSAIFNFFAEVDYASYITTIMIINLNFFSLREALVVVQDLLRRSEDEPALKNNVFDAINVLKTYGCDQERLYTEALLLYDLELARFVASRCQLDPRVYEPHITHLNNLTELRRRYTINVYAKKPKVAISYLLRCPAAASNEIESFIISHKVGKEAYEACPQQSPHFSNVSRLFALELSKKGCHYEAGAVLKRAHLWTEALDEFKLGLKWREVVNLMAHLKFEHVEKTRVVNEIAIKLAQNHAIKDAAILYEFYASNYEMAVKLLIENYFFEEAVHIAKKHNRPDIVVADIVPVLVKHKKYLHEKLVDLQNTFNLQKTRLGEVRKIKALRFNNLTYDDDDRNDLFSDAGSVVSRSSRSSRSRSSTASSRNRRKEEKKKQDLRQGGIYEDIALIRSLYCIIKEIYAKGGEVHSVLILLVQESNVSFKEIQQLYTIYSDIDANIKNSLGEIWPLHFYSHVTSTDNVQILADLENYEHLDIEYRTPPIRHNLSSLNLFKAN